jgi:6-phosphofructokinase 1
LTGLCIGAIAVYTPEEGITLSQLQADIDHLKRSFALDRGENRMGKIVLRNEKASEKAYSTEIISNIIREEAKGRFEARTAVPGHVQQGGLSNLRDVLIVGYPSPMDRVRATRFAVKCCQWLEDSELRKGCTSAVIGIRGSGIVFTDSEKLETQETDFDTRRSKVVWWSDLKKLGNILSTVASRFD